MPTMKLTLLLLASLASFASADWSAAEGKVIEYSSVPGYFLQDDPATDPATFDYASWNLGLLNRTYSTDHKFDPAGDRTQWQRFERWVSYLNKSCKKNNSVKYKVLVMGRHGEGWHNAAESYYGTPAWNVSQPATEMSG